MPIRWIQILILIFLPVHSAHSIVALEAPWDWNASLGIRNYPLGISATGEVGYNVPVWGDRTDSSIWYGYLRPRAGLETSVANTQAQIGLDLSPVSFLVAQFGTSLTGRAFSLDSTCNGDTGPQCLGFLERRWVRLNLKLGYAGIFLLPSVHWELQKSWAEAPYGYRDEIQVLNGANPEDLFYFNRIIGGYRFSPEWAAGILVFNGQMLTSRQSNHLQSIFVRHQRGSLQITAGVGFYESSLNSRALSLYALAEWTGLPSLALGE